VSSFFSPYFFYKRKGKTAETTFALEFFSISAERKNRPAALTKKVTSKITKATQAGSSPLGVPRVTPRGIRP